MKIKLIASDMDDTLLNNNREISPRNEAAIKKAIESGIVFTLASGRMYCSMQPYAQKLGLDVPLVSYNGALVKGALSGKVYVNSPLKLQTALDLLQYVKENGHYVQVYMGDKLYVKEENEYSRMYANISGIQAVAIGEEIYSIKEAPNKLLLMTATENFEATWKDVEEKFKGLVDVTSSKDNYLELMEPGVNKWQAVKQLAESFGIKPEEIMCIGDSNNDLSMIKNAGIGVAVANAKPQVQKYAKMVTASNDKYAKMVTASNDNDGAALAIENILTAQINVPE